MYANHNQKVPSAGIWPLAVTVFTVAMVLTGGISIPSRGMVAFQSIISLVIVACSLFRLSRHGFPTRPSLWGAVLAAGALGLVLLQLIAVPPHVWGLFPGRELVLKNYDLMGVLPGWAALSLTPENTLADGIAMLPALAAFLAVLTVKHRQIFWICGGIVACAIISVAFSLLQHFHGADPAYHLYDVSTGVGVGIFNNRNFFAAQLYTSLPVLSAFAVTAQRKWHLSPTLVLTVGVIFAVIILVGLSLSESRSGILLVMPAILFAVILAYARPRETRRGTAAAAGLLALLFGVLVLGQAGMAGLLRLAQIDPLTDFRATISKNSLEIAIAHFPAGSGFGSFVPLYQLHETPEVMQAVFVNHAHNDWLELLIEGGAPVLALLVAFVVWYLVSLVRVWRYGQGEQTALFQRMASLVIPLLLAHSFVDFPLRTPALMVVFALCCGILVLQPEIGKGGSRKVRSTTAAVPPIRATERKPFQKPKTGFGAGRGGESERIDAGNLQ